MAPPVEDAVRGKSSKVKDTMGPWSPNAAVRRKSPHKRLRRTLPSWDLKLTLLLNEGDWTAAEPLS